MIKNEKGNPTSTPETTPHDEKTATGLLGMSRTAPHGTIKKTGPACSRILLKWRTVKRLAVFGELASDNTVFHFFSLFSTASRKPSIFRHFLLPHVPSVPLVNATNGYFRPIDPGTLLAVIYNVERSISKDVFEIALGRKKPHSGFSPFFNLLN
ncbi:MAG: hypothetical protein GY866_34780 [Proteobacteria bacterium]|nr:hypothetical protein [Pseudomonadota bacterium]